MKLKITVIALSLMLLITGIGYAYNEIIPENKETDINEITLNVEKEVKTKKEKIKNMFSANDIAKLMEEQGYYIDEINNCMSQLLKISSLYDFTEKDFKEFYKVTKTGYNLSEFLEIYVFVLDTNHAKDINYAKKLYEEAKKEKATSKYWIEEAYNRLEDNKHGILSSEDINEYTKKGITFEEIREVNYLSRLGNHKVKEILDRRVKGETWNEITADLYGNKKINKGNMKKINNLTEITSCVYYSDATEEDLEDVISLDETDKISKKAKIKMNGKIQLLLELNKEYKLLESDSEEIIDFAVKKLNIEDRDFIKDCINKGYFIKELEEMKIHADKMGLTLNECI